jgi:hypothetical protein
LRVEREREEEEECEEECDEEECDEDGRDEDGGVCARATGAERSTGTTGSHRASARLCLRRVNMARNVPVREGAVNAQSVAGLPTEWRPAALRRGGDVRAGEDRPPAAALGDTSREEAGGLEGGRRARGG